MVKQAVKELEVRYHSAKDTLYLRVLPLRPARMEETDYDFYVRYDWDHPAHIVGFEWLDFSRYFSVLEEPGVIPDVGMHFNVVGSHLRNASLKEVLCWAYEKYVLQTEQATLMSPPLAAMASPG